MWTSIYESRSDNGGYPVSKPIRIASHYFGTILCIIPDINRVSEFKWKLINDWIKNAISQYEVFI